MKKNFTMLDNSVTNKLDILTSNAAVVYWYICSCINIEDAKGGDEKAFPSLATITEHVPFKISTVRRAIDELVNYRILTKERRFDKSNIYRLGDGMSRDDMEAIKMELKQKSKERIASIGKKKIASKKEIVGKRIITNIFSELEKQMQISIPKKYVTKSAAAIALEKSLIDNPEISFTPLGAN